MPTERILLDTTIQLWRIAYDPEESRKVHAELAGKEVLTTSFVFREFLNTLIADLEYVHMQAAEVLHPAEDGRVGLDRLARFLATGKGNYSLRSIRRLHLVIGSLLESFAETRVPKSKILVRLERTASRWIRDFFRHPGNNGGMRSITCLTHLDDGPDELETLRQGRPFPQKPAFPRETGQFLESAETQVVRVEEEMRRVTKARGRDDKLLKVLGWLKGSDGNFEFTKRLRTQKAWNWALGDLLIALETPNGVAIYSTDRAFKVYSRALGKPRYLGYRAPR